MKLGELFEDVNFTPDMDVGHLSDMMDAAKRGLGLANKIKDPEQRKKHLSRVLSNLNRIRATLMRML